MSDRLVLVERFDELRAGMKVVVRPCGGCDGEHRCFLIRKALHGGAQGWLGDHSPRCPKWSTGRDGMFSERAVAARRVYRVVDGLESTDATTTTSPRKLETVR